MSPPGQLKAIKELTLTILWADGITTQIHVYDILADFELDMRPRLAGALQPELVDDLVRLAGNRDHPELTIRVKMHARSKLGITGNQEWCEPDNCPAFICGGPHYRRYNDAGDECLLRADQEAPPGFTRTERP